MSFKGEHVKASSMNVSTYTGLIEVLLLIYQWARWSTIAIEFLVLKL